MSKKIPFNCPSAVGNEERYIMECLGATRWAADGPFTRRCEAFLESALGVGRVLLTTSCTDALEMAALLLDLQPGDEFIVPSFTYVSTVNAFLLRGARPVFIDIRADTLNADEKLLEGLITPRTRAIVVVHYAGVACEMDAILAIAGRRAIPVVEDNAHGLFATYRGRPLGSIGQLGTLSFHETKNLTCGEGGALLINAAHLAARAEILREKGTNRNQFLSGDVEEYTWVDLGSSFAPSELQAAVLCAQLEAQHKVQARRREIWQAYLEGLAGWAGENHVRLPLVPPYCEHPWHEFYLLMPTPEVRSRFIQHMDEFGVCCVFHYLPLHESKMGIQYAAWNTQCPVTTSVSNCLVRLPLYFSLSDEDTECVLRAARSFKNREDSRTAP